MFSLDINRRLTELLGMCPIQFPIVTLSPELKSLTENVWSSQCGLTVSLVRS